MKTDFPAGPSSMEPMSLEHRPGVIEPLLELAAEVLQKRVAWYSRTKAQDREIYAHLRPVEQCLKSNAIEGVFIPVSEVNAAIQNPEGPKTLARAHVIASLWADQADILSLGINQFLLNLHEIFVDHLPCPLRSLKGTHTAIEPGRWRTFDVRVGAHVPPKAVAVGLCMERLESVYGAFLKKKMKGQAQLTALLHAFVAHHRLVWIHPFDDFNGRLSRIFLDKWLSVCGLPGASLTTISTVLSKNRGKLYRDLLHNADQPRAGALDGRGNLSERELVEFVRFGLNSLQVGF